MKSSRLTAPHPEPNTGVRTTLETHNENGSFDVNIPSIRLNKEGYGTGKYQGKLDVYALSLTESQYRVAEDATNEIFKTRVEIEPEGHVEESGNALVRIWISPSREQYAVVVESGCGAQAVQEAVFSGVTKIVTKWNDEDGEHEETDPYNGMGEVDVMG